MQEQFIMFVRTKQKAYMPRTELQNIEKRAQTRTKILNTALALFARKGFSATTIDDIAREAKISKGLAYNYFRSKKELLHAVIGMIQPMLDEMFQSMDNSLSPSEQIRNLIKISFDSIQNESEFWRLYFMMSVQPDILEEVSNFFNDFISQGISVIEKLFRKCKVSNPKAEARILGAIFDGVGLHFILMKDNYPLNSVKKKLLERYSEKNFCNKK